MYYILYLETAPVPIFQQGPLLSSMYLPLTTVVNIDFAAQHMKVILMNNNIKQRSYNSIQEWFLPRVRGLGGQPSCLPSSMQTIQIPVPQQVVTIAIHKTSSTKTGLWVLHFNYARSSPSMEPPPPPNPPLVLTHSTHNMTLALTDPRGVRETSRHTLCCSIHLNASWGW